VRRDPGESTHERARSVFPWTLDPGGPLRGWIAETRAAIDTRLASLTPDEHTAPAHLHQAMRYALLAPGKRLRPLLTLASARHFGVVDDRALDLGCAIEMVHAASLLLDDLPCMDDADLRRGRATAHLVYGEDTALLAAIALLNLAFVVVSRCQTLDAGVRLAIIEGLATATGSQGLSGGQQIDLQAGKRALAADHLQTLNYMKTSVRFAAAVEAGARAAGIDDPRLAPLHGFAGHLGLAFQIVDDLLDTLNDASLIGKDVGQDAQRSTFVSLLGPERARAQAREHIDRALAVLERYDSSTPVLNDFVACVFGKVLR
jgi:geranylgeranyl diphosphate synthase type II